MNTAPRRQEHLPTAGHQIGSSSARLGIPLHDDQLSSRRRLARLASSLTSLTLSASFAWSAAAWAQVCAPDAARAHAATTVIYDNAGGVTRATTISSSDDGVVQAVDAVTHSLLWSFTPPEVATAPSRTGLLTDVRVLRFDANDDGAIDVNAGDKVWLYFGLREAGAAYYALDITDRSRARVLWKADAASLDGLGEAWSTPSIARVRIAGASQNGEHFALIFGGGYSDSIASAASGSEVLESTGRGKGASTAHGEAVGTGRGEAVGAGNRIVMVDAATGRLLWQAGGPSAGAAGPGAAPDLVLDEMASAIPARINVLDTDGDEFADRLYAIDVSGRLWRFDIWNGRASDELVTGGVLANLGDDPTGGGAGGNAASDESGAPVSSGEARRIFLNAPDVALIQPPGAAPYYNLAVGAGDHFYSIRDRQPFEALSQSSYDASTPILATDLIDISRTLNSTSLPPDAAGWSLDLSAVGAANEEVLAESTTLNGSLIFTTFKPSADPCVASGTTRVYIVRVDDAHVSADLNGDGKITNDDLSTQVPTTGAAQAVKVRMGARLDDPPAAPSGGSPNDANAPMTAPTLAPECVVGTTVLKTCVAADSLQRTYWQRPGVK